MIARPSSPLEDPAGLLCAFRLAPCAQLTGSAEQLLREPGTLWLHFTLADQRARQFLLHRAGIAEDAREALLALGARVHAHIFEDSFVAVLGDLHHDFDSDPEGFGVFRVYMDERRLITCREHRMTSLDRLRQRLVSGTDLETPIELFEVLVHELVEGFASVSAKLSDTVDDAEDEILAGRHSDQRLELGRVRRLLARLRRHVTANRSALISLSRRLGWLDSEQRQELRQVVERLEGVGQDLELVTERARLLQEEIAGRLGEATNRNLYLLSILTTTLLPITLITGIFGMNVAGMPFTQSDHGFWSVMLIMAVTVIGTLMYLRRTGVL